MRCYRCDHPMLLERVVVQRYALRDVPGGVPVIGALEHAHLVMQRLYCPACGLTDETWEEEETR